VAVDGDDTCRKDKKKKKKKRKLEKKRESMLEDELIQVPSYEELFKATGGRRLGKFGPARLQF